MLETVADAAAFECLMEKRRKANDFTSVYGLRRSGRRGGNVCTAKAAVWSVKCKNSPSVVIPLIYYANPCRQRDPMY